MGFRRRSRGLWVAVILRVWPLARLWYRVWGLALEGHPVDEVWYFAYGANMHDGVFRGRRQMRPLEWRPGRIVGYRLRFNLKGRPIGKAAPANISVDRNAEVWGVLYRITRLELVRLNANEGIPGWRYRPVMLRADDAEGNALDVVTYVADGDESDGKPSLRYLTLLRDGARSHGLPEQWVTHLEAVRHAD